MFRSDPPSGSDAGAAYGPAQSAEQLLAGIGLPESADELLAMVRFLTTPEAPLREAAREGEFDLIRDATLRTYAVLEAL